MRLPGAAIFRQSRRHFSQLQTRQRCTHDHLAGKLHSSRAQFETQNRFAREASKPAVKIPQIDVEKQAADEAQHWIAEITMQRRHRSGFDAAFEAIAHDQIRAVAQFFQERLQRIEVVTIVGIAHDNVSPARGGNSGYQGGAVAAGRHIDNPCSELAGNALGAVGAAVVGDDHLAGDAFALKECQPLFDAGGNGFGFIQARHHDRELELIFDRMRHLFERTFVSQSHSVVPRSGLQSASGSIMSRAAGVPPQLIAGRTPTLPA